MPGEHITEITNRHVEGCGTPPTLDRDEWGYLAYYEDQYGEQHILVYDFDQNIGRYYCADAGWERPHEFTGEDILNVDTSDDAQYPARAQMMGLTTEKIVGMAKQIGFIDEEEAEEMAEQDLTDYPESPDELWLRSCVAALQGRVKVSLDRQDQSQESTA